MPKAVHPSEVTVEFKGTYIPDKSAGCGVHDFDEKQGYGEQEFSGAIFEKADKPVEQASISGFVVVDGMSERVAYCTPSKEREKPSNLEP